MAGQIHRQKKNKDFVTIDTHCLRNDGLTWAAKGLHAYLMQLPDDWQVNIEDLERRGQNGRDSTSAAMGLLIEKGYVFRERKHGERGRFEGYDYHLFERPNQLTEWLTVNGKTVDGKTVNGLSVNGFTVYGKSEATKVLTIPNINNTKVNNNSASEFDENFEGNGPSMPRNFVAGRIDFEAEMSAMRDDYNVKAAFSMSRKVPAEKFDGYLAAFKIEVAAREKTYFKRSELREHFLSFSASKYRIEQVPAKGQKQTADEKFIRNLRATAAGIDVEQFR